MILSLSNIVILFASFQRYLCSLSIERESTLSDYEISALVVFEENRNEPTSSLYGRFFKSFCSLNLFVELIDNLDDIFAVYGA